MFKQNRENGNPIKVSELLLDIKESLGLNDKLKIEKLKELWPLVTSIEIAKKSSPQYFDKSNNLVIVTSSSTIGTELSMQKIYIVKRLKDYISNSDISFNDLRFVISNKGL